MVKKRNLENKVNRWLEMFPVVAVIGNFVYYDNLKVVATRCGVKTLCSGDIYVAKICKDIH